ncbi:uncharacterized protein TNCV_1752011 [Trichonephila clavipes]|nr:uncharacterized protein TNCV_1752011 [Trichonephila clavipes]
MPPSQYGRYAPPLVAEWVRLGKTPKETYTMLVRVYEDQALFMKCVYDPIAQFREGRESVSDNPLAEDWQSPSVTSTLRKSRESHEEMKVDGEGRGKVNNCFVEVGSKNNMLTKYQMIKFIDFCEVWFLPESVARVAAIVGDHRCHTPRHRFKETLDVFLGVQQNKQVPHVAKVDVVWQLGGVIWVNR